MNERCYLQGQDKYILRRIFHFLRFKNRTLCNLRATCKFLHSMSLDLHRQTIINHKQFIEAQEDKSTHLYKVVKESTAIHLYNYSQSMQMTHIVDPELIRFKTYVFMNMCTYDEEIKNMLAKVKHKCIVISSQP